MLRVKAYERDLYVNLLKRNTLHNLGLCVLNKIFQPVQHKVRIFRHLDRIRRNDTVMTLNVS